MSNIDNVCQLLNLEIKDKSFLETALIHRSYSANHNERLEFIGDSILNFIIATALYTKFSDATEGQLSRFRASLVKGETLADLAKHFNLGKHLKLGQGEKKTGGDNRPSILANAMEAIIGAIYLDSGFDYTEATVLSWYKDRIDALTHDNDNKDPKTQLQEYLQSKRSPLPDYKVVEIKGEAHNQIFVVSCKVEGVNAAIMEGTSRRKAEQAAAASVLEELLDGK